jgi:hypothetical protein
MKAALEYVGMGILILAACILACVVAILAVWGTMWVAWGMWYVMELMSWPWGIQL